MINLVCKCFLAMQTKDVYALTGPVPLSPSTLQNGRIKRKDDILLPQGPNFTVSCHFILLRSTLKAPMLDFALISRKSCLTSFRTLH